MKNVVFWDVAPCRSCVNRRSSETSIHTKYAWRNIPEDGILHSHRRENLKSYKLRSWLPTGPETMNDCAGEDQQ
jgi:hypothetical protein